jgi:hypothetical protein
MSTYIRLAEGLSKYKLIPTTENIWDHISSNDKDYYVSIFQYNDSHYKQWKEKKTVSGIKDVVTNKLVFDFDNSANPEEARTETVELVTRLLKKGINESAIQASFSGSKGYCVEVDTTDTMTPEEFKNVTFALAGDLKHFDTVVNDPNRIVRVVGTKHPKSGLYKYPLTVKQLSELDTNTIKSLAKDINNIDEDVINSWVQTDLPESIKEYKKTKEKVKEVIEVIDHDLDLSKKPKWLTDAKYALQEGFFGSGERNTAFMILASTYKNQGFSKEIIYRMLKGVAEIQARRNGVDRYSDEELYNNIVEVVTNPTWKGGMYSYENTPLLQEVTKRLGLKVPKDEEIQLVPVDNVSEVFRKFATEIDKNTIKLGINQVDSEVRVTTSMLVGLLAAPSAGKTSVSLGILNSLSKSNLKAIFFSLDMGAPLVYQRLVQKHTGMSGKKIFEMYKNKDSRLLEFEKRVSDEYKNVRFCFRSGITTDDIRSFILKQQEVDGERAKLVVVDYLECIAGPYSDATANTSLIAQQLKDIANELEVCIVLLLQPQKHAGDPASELLSMRNIKGSSVVEQACSIIFTMWRPGFSPKNPDEDMYLTIAVVKNRMGQLGSYDFGWNGLTGDLSELDELERGELDELRKRRALEKAEEEL